MIGEYKPVPRLLYNRIILLLVTTVGAYLATKLLRLPFYIDKSLVFSVLVVAIAAAWFIFFRTIKNPLLTALIPNMFVFWLVLDRFMSKIAFSFKPHYLAIGFILVAGIMTFYKEAKYLWNFQLIRFLFLFLIINIFYFFFHSSDFNVSNEGFVYGWEGGSRGKDAKLIVFLDSIFCFLASCVPAALFSSIKSLDEFKNYMHKTGNIFYFGFILMFLTLPFILGSLPSGKQIFLPLTFLFILGLKLFIDLYYEKNNLYNFFFLVILLGIAFLSIDSSNKTALVAFIGAIGFFILLNILYVKINFKTVVLPKTKFLTPLVIFITLVIAVVIAERLELINLIIDKFAKSIRAVTEFSGITSWYIRQNNWHYFLLDWKNNFNLLNLLFGFGLGASRETIFYISAMQYSEIYLVQTTHNQFMEMFYDYGLVCLLFYVPLVTISVKNVYDLVFKNYDKPIKLFAAISLSMMSFFFVYHITDGLRVEIAVIFFSYLSFVEMAKFTLIQLFNKNQVFDKS